MKKANDFELKDKDEKTITLYNIESEFIVLYFYPKDNTPGCTLEAHDFNFLQNAFKEQNTEIIGISGGDAKSKSKFCEKNKLSITLLSDTDFKVSTQYGVYGEKKFMGKTYMGIKRTTFIINKDKEIIKVFENVKVKNHANEVLDFIKEVKNG